MEMLLATKASTPIIGQVAALMGMIMDGIYRLLNLIGVHNLGLCIIVFSIIIYLLMTPLQIQQQKFSKLSAVMQPELQKVQKKYAGKKDQESIQRMNEEQQAVYQKYGVSPTGSCVQLGIQFPVLMALWQVIYRIPAYVGSVKAIFTDVVAQITQVDGYTELIQNFISDNKMSRVRLVVNEGIATSDSVIDFLYALSPTQWKTLASMKEFAGSADAINVAQGKLSGMQSFLGLNIAEQPLNYIKEVVAGGSIVLAIIAVLIPVCAWATQMLNIRLMPQAGQNTQDQNSAMAGSMKTMNTVMPLMSAVFCFTFPVGLGIYWVSSALVRSVQQVLINRHLDKIDMDELINANMKKMEKKRTKEGLPPQKITTQAHQNVKNINTKIDKGNSHTDENSRDAKVKNAYDNAKNAAPGSITAKANMVRDFEERKKKK